VLFTDLKLSEPIQKRLAEKGFPEPTPIQAATIPLSLNNRDLIACAKTGSGKTLAYLLPILQYVHEKGAGSTGPYALVLAPTRELVVQIADEADFFAEAAGLRLATIFGGVDHDKQRRELAQGPHLIVATPGRLLDFLRGGELNLSSVTRIVLDEADRMLDMGFIDDVRKILSKCAPIPAEKDSAPAGDESKESAEPQLSDRQFSLFSATINFSALYSVWEFMREPEEILINPELIDHANIEQEMYHLGQDEKLPYLIQFLEANKLEPVIIFTNSRQYVDVLVKNLNHHNIAAEGLSSMVTQNRRLRILDDFKENKFRVLVATDVASRGLHIEDIQLVVNYDIPMDSETYVHRIGRTARAGKTGKAMSFSSEFDYDSLAKLERYVKYKIPVVQPEQRFIENVSFVRIVSAGRDDGGDHARPSGRNRDGDRGRRPERGRGREGARAAGGRERNQRSGGARQDRSGQARQDQFGRSGRDQQAQGRRNETRSAQGARGDKKDQAYFDSRRPKRGNDKPREKKSGRENFRVIARGAQPAGFMGRLWNKIKSVFSRGKSTPQISERTRQLIEQERSHSGEGNRNRNNRNRRDGRGQNNRNRRGPKPQGKKPR